MSFRQCQAHNKSRQQCQRVAHQDSDYCFSHRNCSPKADYSHLDPIRDLHIEVDGNFHPAVICESCGEMVHDDDGIVSLTREDGSPYILCSRCGMFQLEIEARISEICSYLPDGITKEKIIEDLAVFGVSEDQTEQVRKRMLREGRLVES